MRIMLTVLFPFISIPNLSLAQNAPPCESVIQCAQLAADSARLAAEAANRAPPTGAVVAFNLTACPMGWKEYEPAYGRFIRGIDKSGDGIDPRGPRTPGNLQGDQFEKHVHSLREKFHVWETSSHRDATTGTGDPHQKNDRIETRSAGGSETRPKNVALLYCERT